MQTLQVGRSPIQFAMLYLRSSPSGGLIWKNFPRLDALLKVENRYFVLNFFSKRSKKKISEHIYSINSIGRSRKFWGHEVALKEASRIEGLPTRMKIDPFPPSFFVVPSDAFKKGA